MPKRVLDHKISGVFRHKLNDNRNPIFEDLTTSSMCLTAASARCCARMLSVRGLDIIAESEESGIYMVMHAAEGFFITGHSEYSPNTLDFEYRRDLDKGMNPDIPAHYYIDDDR
ncbi:homoserine O-acetyltransferase/O-succinyltransferase family protein [Muribaculum gordoncarteri]|uniref:homoserine O-acetyltransferase/O-succinyltransferase family protein n=1 Tax=Muribaculum gordoncarteri TaxID=2530390 RepID=UPI003F66F4F6